MRSALLLSVFSLHEVRKKAERYLEMHRPIPMMLATFLSR
jgi:hypothetical protein